MQVEFGATESWVAPHARVLPDELERLIREDDDGLRALDLSRPVEQLIEKFGAATRTGVKGRYIEDRVPWGAAC